MPVKIEYANDGTGVYTNYYDAVTGNEIYDTVRIILEDDRYLSLEFWLSDRSRITHFDVSSEVALAIGKLASMYSKVNPTLAIAVVNPTDIEFAITRMIELQANNPNPYFVCRSRTEAEEWIVKNRKGKPMPDPES